MKGPRDFDGRPVHVGDRLVGPDGMVHTVASMTISRVGWHVRFEDRARLDYAECVHADTIAEIVTDAAMLGYEAGLRRSRSVDLRDVCARLARL